MENSAAESLLRQSLHKIQNPDKLREIVSDYILQIRTQMNTTEDNKLLYPMMDRGYFVLSEIEKESLLPEKPLTEVITKMNTIGCWDLRFEQGHMDYENVIDAIREHIPSNTTETRLSYEAHRLFISFILNVQRLEIRDSQRLNAQEAFYKKLADRFGQIQQ